MAHVSTVISVYVAARNVRGTHALCTRSRWNILLDLILVSFIDVFHSGPIVEIVH